MSPVAQVAMRALLRSVTAPVASRDRLEEFISLRQCMETHEWGANISLRLARQLYRTPASGNGYASGCHWRTSGTVYEDLAWVIPSWAPVDDERDREVQGVLEVSKISGTDFPLKPWHHSYDWNFFVRPDPQYQHLLAPYNLYEAHEGKGRIECEWDTDGLPYWCRPQATNRIWMVGRWIYDCGHPTQFNHKTELHPPKAFAAASMGTWHFTGNVGPTRATVVKFFASNWGGYWQNNILGRDYAFNAYLPPRPSLNSEPRFSYVSTDGPPPVAPSVSWLPAGAPRLARVRIPLSEVAVLPEGSYGVQLFLGWSDPDGTQAARVRRCRVRLRTISMFGDYDAGPDEWHLYVCVNGVWFYFPWLSGDLAELNKEVTLDLDPADEVLVSSCAFEADAPHDYMGESSGYTWARISDPALTREDREDIEDDLAWQLLPAALDAENNVIGRSHAAHVATDRGAFVTDGSWEGNGRITAYRIVYYIEDP